ncbi:MAG: hypothetical protein HZA54_04435 [Planctomycetes bacterium]|nr:hypothetical protein [Planctomycetota bacterium]
MVHRSTRRERSIGSMALAVATLSLLGCKAATSDGDAFSYFELPNGYVIRERWLPRLHGAPLPRRDLLAPADLGDELDADERLENWYSNPNTADAVLEWASQAPLRQETLVLLSRQIWRPHFFAQGSLAVLGWSTTGDHFAWTSDHREVWVLQAPSQTTRRLMVTPAGTYPLIEWSPRGKALCVRVIKQPMTPEELYELSLSSGLARRVGVVNMAELPDDMRVEDTWNWTPEGDSDVLHIRTPARTVAPAGGRSDAQ